MTGGDLGRRDCEVRAEQSTVVYNRFLEPAGPTGKDRRSGSLARASCGFWEERAGAGTEITYFTARQGGTTGTMSAELRPVAICSGTRYIAES